MKHVVDIVNYVWNHKKRDLVFEGWSKDELARAFATGFATECATWSEWEDGSISGVVLTRVTEEGRLHIIGILADDKRALKGFMGVYKKFHAGREIVGRRRGEVKNFRIQNRI